MNDYETLPRAPITEALIDIQIGADAAISVDSLAAFGEEIAPSYPGRIVINAFRAEFAVTSTGVQDVSRGSAPQQLGFRFQNADATQVVQARTDGFAFSRLKPYSNWLEIYGEARKLWERYRAATGATSVSRLAVRYINKIELPLPFADFREYMLTIPEIAPGIPQGLAQFFMQLVVPFEDIGAIAIVNQTIAAVERTTATLPVIFDIEVNKVLSMESSSEALWGHLDELRTAKNLIFFRSITPKCLELFR